MGIYCLMGTEFLFGVMKRNVLEMGGGNGYKQCECTLYP